MTPVVRERSTEVRGRSTEVSEATMEAAEVLAHLPMILEPKIQPSAEFERQGTAPSILSAGTFAR